MQEMYRSLEQLWLEMYQMTGDRQHRDMMLYWKKRADHPMMAMKEQMPSIIKETR